MKFLKEKTLKKSIKENVSPRSITPLKEAITIGFLLDDSVEETDWRILQQWQNGLENAGKKVTICQLQSNKLKKGEELDLNPLRPHKNHFRANGKAKIKEVIDFNNTPFDYLILFEENPSAEIQIMAASSKAKLRIGMDSKENKKYCDFLIRIPSGSTIESYILSLEKAVREIGG